MKISTKIISPELANQILKVNTSNRTPIKANIDYIVNQMETNKWMVAGETLKFSKKW